MKPVRLPAAATIALPRWGVIALCLLYILPGLVRRDPWKAEDAAGFGIMWTMAHGGLQDWLAPNIVGMPMPAEGPLTFWIGAIFIWLFGWLLDDALASRLSIIAFFAIGAASVWHAAFRLGRRAEAQPLRLAFGGQPAPDDYGRTLADGALLIYLASLGLLLQAHQTSAEALLVSLVAAALFAGIRLFEKQNLASGALLGMVLGALVLTRGWTVPAALLVVFLGLAASWRRQLLKPLLLTTLPLFLLLPGLWFAAVAALLSPAESPIPAWMAWNRAQLALPSDASLRYLLRYGIWFTWPAWPFAAWAVYAWRKQTQALHIILPLAFVVASLLLVLSNPHPEEASLLPFLPPLAILAAFGLPTMKRGAINAVDWFAVMTLSTCAAFIWMGWIAKQTGWPAQLARNDFKLAPGFQPEFSFAAFSMAAAATLGWLLLVYWRLSRQPSVLWRAVVLSSGGVILCWLLLMTLWLPWLNYGKSYAGVATQIAHHLPASHACVISNVGPAQRASFAYFGDIRFAPVNSKENCPYLLLQGHASDPAPKTLRHYNSQNWQLLWEGRRPSDRHERFRLYERVAE